MDCAEIKVEMAEEGLPRRLHITEDRDTTEGVSAKDADITSAFTVKSYSEHSALKKEEEHTEVEDKKEEDAASEMCLEEQSLGNQQEAKAEDFKERGGKPEDTENMSEGQSADDSKSDKQTLETMRINEKPEKPSQTEDEKVKGNDPQVDIQSLNSSEQQPEGDTKKAHRLTPDFPESLYELLCTLQEGRRLNDQRCSFSLEAGGLRRRRCHSEPNTGKPAHRVVFSSMTSLQKEEFFELVATSQARRLDDQRAQLERSPPTKTKGRSFRGSLKQLSFVRRPVSVPAPAPAAAPVPKEDLYNMILTTQAQGRLEDQRSRAPGPMDDEDFFSLLLRVQGGRMEEQRTELPCLLQT